METSKTQLQNRYSPIQALSHEGNTWTFQSETSTRIYTTTRNGNTYTCTCPSAGLCKHITSAILDDAKPKFGIVQVWTSEQDAKRQRRRMFQIRASTKPAWVTVGQPVDLLAKIESEIAELGRQYLAAQRRWYSVSAGQIKSDARIELARLRGLMMEAQKAREHEAGKRVYQS